MYQRNPSLHSASFQKRKGEGGEEKQKKKKEMTGVVTAVSNNASSIERGEETRRKKKDKRLERIRGTMKRRRWKGDRGGRERRVVGRPAPLSSVG